MTGSAGTNHGATWTISAEHYLSRVQAVAEAIRGGVIDGTTTGYAYSMTADPLMAATPARFDRAGAADAVTAAELRRALRGWLNEATEVPADVCDDIILGAGEALANCVEHAYRAHHTVGTMELEASHDPAARSIRVCVSDRGTWHRPSPKKPNDPRASRGIMLMHALADHCTINAHPSGTTVCLDYTTDPNALETPASDT
jgi:anti-sigma regulatory factor (Ser/Thr protein kinase)